jgi:hypothetical protein
LNGNSGSSGIRPLTGRGNLFERNHTDRFVVECVDLGTSIDSVEIMHDGEYKYILFDTHLYHGQTFSGSGGGSDWFLESIVVITGTGNSFFFPHGDWLAVDNKTGKAQAVISMKPSETMACVPLVQYTCEVHTVWNTLLFIVLFCFVLFCFVLFCLFYSSSKGDRRGAGTSANCFVCICGDKGESGNLQLSSRTAKFERNGTDIFILSCPEVGIIQKIRIGHDVRKFLLASF